jgi:surface antigen
MNRRSIIARSVVSSPAIMLAVGLVTMAPSPATRDVLEVAAQPPDSEGRSLAVEPMGGRLPHEIDPSPTPTAAPVAVAPSSVPAPVPVKASPARPRTAGTGRFAYGYCTWWVASRRPIPWTGNAWQWWGNARAFGFAEGYAPRPGAVMVMGISGSSPQGHVAYVESVSADGSFTVSEMNWWGVPGGGWGRVDYRRVTSMAGVIGFIY